MERKTCWVAVKGGRSGSTKNGLAGYASVKNEVDATGDVILDGAYGDLAEFIESGFVAVGHDHSSPPVGFVVSAKEDAKGLWVAMEFHSTSTAQEARIVAEERLAAGKRVGLSIGFLPVEWTFENRNGRRVRLLQRIDLKEFSLVSLPTARGAVVSQPARPEDILGLARAWQRHQKQQD